MTGPALIVIAKEPRPGHSKTRLCPPCSPREAAWLAETALSETLEAAAITPAARHVLVLDGAPGDWLPAGFELIPQRDGGLGERLAGAFADVGRSGLLIGMDTPQVTPALLTECLARLDDSADAVLGPAPDGGFWAIGLRECPGGLFDEVPMSTHDSCRAMRASLAAHALAVHDLPWLRDIDTIDDALAVAGEPGAPRFTAALNRLGLRWIAAA